MKAILDGIEAKFWWLLSMHVKILSFVNHISHSLIMTHVLNDRSLNCNSSLILPRTIIFFTITWRWERELLRYLTFFFLFMLSIHVGYHVEEEEDIVVVKVLFNLVFKIIYYYCCCCCCSPWVTKVIFMSKLQQCLHRVHNLLHHICFRSFELQLLDILESAMPLQQLHSKDQYNYIPKITGHNMNM